MAPRAPSRKDPVDKESPRKASKKKTERPSSKTKQIAAEARAEQEIDGEPPTRATRSKNSQSNSTSNVNAASPTKVTKSKRKESSKSKKASKPAHDKAVDDGTTGSEKSIESANPFAKKSNKVDSPVAGGPAKGTKPRGRPPGKKTPAPSYQDLIKAINNAAYEAVLEGGIEALTAYQDYDSNASVAEYDFVNATNAGAMRAIKKLAEYQRLQKKEHLHENSSGQTHVDAARHRHVPPSEIAAKQLYTAPPVTKTKKKKKLPDAKKKKAIPAITPPVSPTKVDLKAQMERQRADELKERNKLLHSGLPVASTTTDRDIPLPGLSELSQRGNMISSTNPGIITIMVDDHAQDRINPFFETLPGPEIWYRNMPPFFNFGETKFMEQQISDQINEDLAREHPGPVSRKPPAAAKSTESIASKVLSPFKGMLGVGGTARASIDQDQPGPAAGEGDENAGGPPELRPDQWVLPELSNKEKHALQKKSSMKSGPPDLTQGFQFSSPNKRWAPPTVFQTSPKRGRTGR